MHTLQISLILFVLTLAVIYRWRNIMARQRNEPCPSLNTTTGRGYRLGIFSASDRSTEKDLAAVTMDSIPRCDPHCDPRNAAGLTDSNESFCLKCGAFVKNR